MKKITLLVCTMMIAVCAFAKQDGPKTVSLTQQEQTMVSENNKFAFRLIGQARSEKPDESLMLSPMSITTLLSMLNNGATGQTEQEIRQTLGFADYNAAAINTLCHKLMTQATTLDDKTTVTMANNIYVNTDRGYHLRPAFANIALDYYDATPESRSFSDGQTRDVINQWGSDHTNGMIKEVLKPSEFNPLCISYLLNALYFKGEWSSKFDASHTTKTYFNGMSKYADMMWQIGEFQYCRRKSYESVVMPYGSGAYNMTVFLPSYGKTIADVLAELASTDWEQYYSDYFVDLYFPRFETSTDMRLEQTMQALGMVQAFYPEEALFNEFCEDADGNSRRCYIDMMKQVAKIKVDEEGSEAAAVTVIGMKDGVDETPWAEFVADRTFLYVIREQSTGAILFIGQYTGDEIENERHDITLTAEEKQLVKQNNDFAFRLFQKARGEGSSIMSPLSITYALGMLNNGAAGQTQQEISDVLATGVGSPDAINALCRKLMDELGKADNTTKMLIGNTVFVNEGKGYRLQDAFIQKANDFYDAQPQARDFADGQTRNVINQWGSDHTNGLIKEILTEDEFDPTMVSYLLNAIYFKGTWAEKFDPANTRDELFGGAVTVPMMHQNSEFQYTENDDYQAVHLPYGNEAFRLTLYLPREGKTIGDVVEKMNGGNWNFGGGNYDVDLKMPRFETSTSLQLNKIMSDLGMPSAFNPMTAEFPNFCNSDIFIGNMKQDARIMLDEKGTEAAAVTLIGVATSAMPMTATLHADRPFFYIISEQSTGIILFMGQYTADLPTAINANKRETINNNRYVYDLQGRRVSESDIRKIVNCKFVNRKLQQGRKIVNRKFVNRKLQQGLYIMDGKKVIVK